MTGVRYQPRGVQAFDMLLLEASFGPPKLALERNFAALGFVDISGPVAQRFDPMSGVFCAYSDVIRCVEGQLSRPETKVVVMVIHSPGGSVVGMPEAARTIRALGEQYGKRIVAYCEYAASAAYALAVGATEIVCGETSPVGSIGCFERRMDVSEKLAKDGVKVEYLRSARMKALTQIEEPITDEERAEIQARVAAFDMMFGALVTDLRPSAKFEPLAGSTVIGAAALKAGLVDRVETFDAMCMRLCRELEARDDITNNGEINKMGKYARASIEAAAKEGDEEAKALLAQMKASEDTEKPKEDPKKTEESDGKAEGDPPSEDTDEEDEKTKPAQARASGKVVSLADIRSAAREASEVEACIARRYDLPEAVTKIWRDLPLAQVRAMADSIPRAVSPVAAAIAGAKASASGQSPNASPEASSDIAGVTHASPHAKALDAAFFPQVGPKTHYENGTLTLGAKR